MNTSVDRLDQFIKSAYASIEEVYSKKELSDHLNAISSLYPQLVSELESIGSYYDGISSNSKDWKDIDTEKYIVLFYWLDDAKEFLILWRDVTLEQTKALHYYRDDKVSQMQVAEQMTRSQRILKECLFNLGLSYGRHYREIDSPVSKSMIKDWSIQINPWPLYREQIKSLTEQTRSIGNLSNQIHRSSLGFNTIRRILSSYLDKREQNMIQIEQFADDAISCIKDLSVDSEVKEITAKIKRIDGVHHKLNKLFVSNHHLEQIERILDDMTDRLSVPVSTDKGTLRVKELNLSKNTLQWLESEIYLILYEIEAIEDSLKNNLKMTLVNLKNRLTLLINGSNEDDGALVREAVEKFKRQYQESAANHQDLLKQAQAKLTGEFNISDVFDVNRTFMPVTMEPSISNIDLTPQKLRHKVKQWMQTSFSLFSKYQDKAREERWLSTSEKIVRYIDAKRLSDSNNQYNHVFLVKGYIGESFVIGRSEEYRHLTEVYQKWKDGYRGSALITGQRYSGKSLFVEYANIKMVDGKAIMLKPGYPFEINDKPKQATHDIRETLNEITKYTTTLKPVVIIDDIEAWFDKDHSMAYNLRQISFIMDKYASKMFFIVTMSNWLKHKMDQLMDITASFQTVINLDRMSLDEIREIINIRQGATYKKLLNAKGTQLQPEEFDKITRKIYHETQGNVGDSLAKWAAHMRFVSVDTIQYHEGESYSLPDITDHDTLLVLETIIMSRKTNEYYLIRLFGDAFRTRYSQILQRLISTGLIVRNVDNLIQINPYAVNDIGRLLARKNYIKFNHG